MYARSTTFTGKPDAIGPAIALVRDEVMPAVQEMEGCSGLSMLVDRDTGSCIVTTAWQDEQTMRSSEGRVAALRDKAQPLFGGRPEVRIWEIALLHRLRQAEPGAAARITWTRIEPAGIDDMVRTFREEVLPRVDELPGFCSTSLLVDRTTGMGALAATYDSREALEGNREAVARLREQTLSRSGGQLIDIAEMEVALAHLRVPETV